MLAELTSLREMSTFFPEIWIIIESVESKKKVYNSGHNMLKRYIVLVKVKFATSKTKLDA